MTTARALNKQQFAHLIPHAGEMTLIDQVDHWEEKHIICRTRSHLDSANPLYFKKKLSSIHLLEYGAQAIAIHGGLLSGKQKPGFLASIRDAEFYCDELHTITDDLVVSAHALLNTHNGGIYKINVNTANQRKLITAEATVINL